MSAAPALNLDDNAEPLRTKAALLGRAHVMLGGCYWRLSRAKTPAEADTLIKHIDRLRIRIRQIERI